MSNISFSDNWQLAKYLQSSVIGVELSTELADFAHNDVAKQYGADISLRIQIVPVKAITRILIPFSESLVAVAR